MKKVLILILAVTLIFTILSAEEQADSIVICSSMEQFRSDALQEQLQARFPDQDVFVMYMPTGKAAAKIFAEGTRTEVDIILGLETGYMNKIQKNLADISHASRLPYLPEVDTVSNNGRWVTWERQAGAIIYNKTLLDRLGLEIPTTYEDLLKPEYKGLIAMPDPKSSGTGYFFYKNWVNVMGEEAALAYTDALYQNIKQFTESGSGPIKLLKQGEIAVGLALTFQAVNEINNGHPLGIAFPNTGSPYSLTGTAVIEGHQKKPGVQEVFDFIIHDFMVYDKENFSPEIVYEGQINRIPGYPTDISYADMSGIQNAKEKERLLDLWKY